MREKERGSPAGSDWQELGGGNEGWWFFWKTTTKKKRKIMKNKNKNKKWQRRNGAAHVSTSGCLGREQKSKMGKKKNGGVPLVWEWIMREKWEKMEQKKWGRRKICAGSQLWGVWGEEEMIACPAGVPWFWSPDGSNQQNL